MKLKGAVNLWRKMYGIVVEARWQAIEEGNPEILFVTNAILYALEDAERQIEANRQERATTTSHARSCREKPQ